MYSDELINDVLAHCDIVDIISSYIPIINRGRTILAVCPFHDDSDPSLHISREKQIFKCFVCGNGGNAIGFVMKYEKISFDEAVRKVAELSGYSDPRLLSNVKVVKIPEDIAKLYSTIDDLQKYYQYGLTIPEGAVAKDYLDKRNISADQISKYGLGYAPIDGEMTVKYLTAKKHSLKDIEDIGIGYIHASGLKDGNAGRLIFPLCNPKGQVVGFSARQLVKSDSGKYINSPETKIFHKGNLLYNYHRVYESAKHDGYCYLVEGFMDVMALDKAGIPNAVALCGTALTKDQVALLSKLKCEIRFCLDGDEAGQSNMMKSISLLQKASLHVRVVDYNGDLRDPDDILQEDGAEALKKRMERLVDPIEFRINYYRNTKKLEKAEDRVKVLNAFLPFLRSLPLGIEQEDYLVKISEATGYEIEAIRAMLKQAPSSNENAETATFVKATTPLLEPILNPINSQRRRRLDNAERRILYYMLHDKKAFEFYVNQIGSFNNQTYEDVANFVSEYLESHECVDINGVVSAVESSGVENSDELSDSITSIAFENHPPLAPGELEVIKKTIEKEKSAISARIKASDAIKNDPNNAGDAIKQFGKAKHEK